MCGHSLICCQAEGVLAVEFLEHCFGPLSLGHRMGVGLKQEQRHEELCGWGRRGAVTRRALDLPARASHPTFSIMSAHSWTTATQLTSLNSIFSPVRWSEHYPHEGLLSRSNVEEVWVESLYTTC